ncbi:MAG: ferritin family protein, partial [bacterium]|nr:ferritin family protein [bacterium]
MEYSLCDLIELAVNIEREGVEFYEILARYAKSSKTRDLFKELADDERNHERFFRNLKNLYNISEKEAVEDEDMTKLIEQITHHNVFPELKPDKIGGFHPLSAIKIGMKTEKSTIKFYKRLLKSIKDENSRTALKQLINEEEK